MTDAKGNVTQRADFSKDQVKQVAAFEKSYTRAVNELASHPDRMAPLSIGGSKLVEVPAGAIAQKLSDTQVTAVPSLATRPGTQDSMDSPTPHNTIVYGSGLKGSPGYGENQNVRNSPDLMREVGIVHEGMHWTRADNSSSLPNWFRLHQERFNQAAEKLLGLTP